MGLYVSKQNLTSNRYGAGVRWTLNKADPHMHVTRRALKSAVGAA
jgi:hypothetical protein